MLIVLKKESNIQAKAYQLHSLPFAKIVAPVANELRGPLSTTTMSSFPLFKIFAPKRLDDKAVNEVAVKMRFNRTRSPNVDFIAVQA